MSKDDVVSGLALPAYPADASPEFAALWQKHQELQTKIKAWKDAIENLSEDEELDYALLAWLLDEFVMALDKP